MRYNFVTVFSACLLSVVAVTWTAARQAPAPVSSAAIDEMLKAFRGDLQNSRADTISKNVQLTSTQAAQFWPLFES